MPSITRPRIIAATAFLGIATLLGTTAAAAAAPAVTGTQPAMQHEGTSAMQGESLPGMQGEGTLAMQGESQPGMQGE
jgi:Spy/CpxP family protein refolding chaperone